MNTDTLFSLAIDINAERLRDAERERRARAAATRPSASLAAARYAVGSAFITAGRYLQGITESLPESRPLGEPRPAGAPGR